MHAPGPAITGLVKSATSCAAPARQPPYRLRITRIVHFSTRPVFLFSQFHFPANPLRCFIETRSRYSRIKIPAASTKSVAREHSCSQCKFAGCCILLRLRWTIPLASLRTTRSSCKSNLARSNCSADMPAATTLRRAAAPLSPCSTARVSQ